MARWGNCDYRQLQRLQQKLNKLQSGDVDAFCKGCAKELAARLLTKVIKRTPVGQYDIGAGKVGGTLRRGWTAKSSREAELSTVFNAKPTNIRDYVDTLQISKSGSMYQIEIINPVEYAPYVEFGHRTANHKGWVPGRFMLTISEQELESQAPQILERKIKRYLEGIFSD
nr:MAG TPA: type I neck protein [Caudoviricetes sp.]